MKLQYIALASALLASSALAQNAPSGSPRVQGTPDGFGAPVQVTIVAADGSDVSGTPVTGTVAIDQTTPGTTNGVALEQIGSTTVAAGNGVTGAGSLRVTIASDNTAFAVTPGGNVANNAVDSGNPVKIGGVAGDNNNIPTAVTMGDRVNLFLGPNGQVLIGGMSQDGSDGFPNTALAYMSRSSDGNIAMLPNANNVFNGSGWDRQRGDTNGTYSVPAPSAVAATGVAVSATTAAAGSLVGKASAGNLYGYNVTTGASAGYIMVFNATSAPADGAVTPSRCIPIAANTGIEVRFPMPIYHSTGITIVFSTTGCFSKTISATAFIAADVK